MMIDPKQVEFDGKLVPGGAKSFMKDTGSSSRDLWQVDVGLVKVLPNFNVRIKDDKYVDHIRRLADSMKEEGFYQDKPLAGYVAKEGQEQVIYITDGHCRLEAVRLAIKEGAEIVKVPVVVASAGSSMEDLTVALVRANDGKPLTPLEIAIVCRRLTKFNWEVKEIARRLGFSQNYVEGLLLLIGAPQEVRAMVESGEVSASTAIGILRSDGDKAYEKLQEGLEKAKAKGKDKVTKKHMATGGFKKEVKKVAPRLFVTLREVRNDPGYKSIGEGLREKLEQLLSQLDGLDGIDEAIAATDETKKVKPAAKKTKAAAAKKTKQKVAGQEVSERAEPVPKRGPMRVVVKAK
jgi:ParB family chromosome partitioning protein